MTDPSLQAKGALAAARQALHQGNRRLARRYIETALALDPELEDAWLMLAAVASPEASLAYLRRALEINPHSQRAREGMRWALKRQRAAPERRTRPQVRPNLPAQAITYKRRPLLPWLLLVLVVAAGLVAWYEAAPIQMALALADGNPPGRPAADLVKPTLTPTPTNTPTPTPTPTNTPTPTATPTETPTPLPTDTPVPTPVPEDVSAPDQKAPLDRPADEFWIDVDLTNQSAYAYQGTELLRSFVVSTGTWLHPTLTGEYKIYVKYRYADMAGPGYYLPNVPYVMYYDQGYGLHGTYWHSNFGTPMSHGCINFRTEDAGWIFSRASVGTLVNIHY